MNNTAFTDPIALLLLSMAMAIVPFAAMIVTSYTKISIVLGLLRNALGVQQVPPNMVLNGVAIILSCYIMAPLMMEATDSLSQTKKIVGTTSSDQILDAVSAVREPFRRFLKKHAADREVQFFLRSATTVWPPEYASRIGKDDLIVLAPAFLLSELTAAFRIGFLLYLAFVVIDIVIANILLAMGLSQVSPTSIAVPFKLLLFVTLDGWSRLMHGLVLTYK
jgi:type III secretion protein R